MLNRLIVRGSARQGEGDLYRPPRPQHPWVAPCAHTTNMLVAQPSFSSNSIEERYSKKSQKQNPPYRCCAAQEYSKVSCVLLIIIFLVNFCGGILCALFFVFCGGANIACYMSFASPSKPQRCRAVSLVSVGS